MWPFTKPDLRPVLIVCEPIVAPPGSAVVLKPTTRLTAAQRDSIRAWAKEASARMGVTFAVIEGFEVSVEEPQ